jgi:hypothetical protein
MVSGVYIYACHLGTNTDTKGQMTPSEERNRAFVLTIRPLPDRTPVEIRLRHVLKRLLRSYGFRCVSCRPDQPNQRNENETP